MWDPDAFYIDVEPKLMMPEAENDVCMPSLCFHEFFLLSLEVISVWWEWVGVRNLLGNTKISPWKRRYRLEIRLEIVLISISKKVSPGGNQALPSMESWQQKINSSQQRKINYVVSNIKTSRIFLYILIFCASCNSVIQFCIFV